MTTNPLRTHLHEHADPVALLVGAAVNLLPLHLDDLDLA